MSGNKDIIKNIPEKLIKTDKYNKNSSEQEEIYK